MKLDAYDAGLLGGHGKGDVDWWQDYIRAELERAHEHYENQAAVAIADLEAQVQSLTGALAEEAAMWASVDAERQALVGELGEALAECADDLEAEVRDRWFMGGTEVHPALEHKFERDMAPVNKARVPALDQE